MIDYLDIRTICHSSFSEEEKATRKAEITPFNRDLLMDLPSQVRDIMDQLYWSYKDQPWFEEAWEKYREHVLDAGLGGKIKMPGFVFNEYIDRYVDEQEKRRNKELAHMDACDIDELYHHGIKGQRWGVRRYQNEDGSLTEEGKERYSNNGEKVFTNNKMADEYCEHLNKNGKYYRRYYANGLLKTEYHISEMSEEDAKKQLYKNEYDRQTKNIEKYHNQANHSDDLVDEYLEHHGVKGQKWGIRRYQNDDGTLTAEGRKRYGVDNLADMSKEQRKLYEQDRRESLKSAKADIKRQGLKTNYIGGTKNLERLNRGADMIRSKYGQLTLDDFAADESKKATRVAIGTSLVAMLASFGGMALMIKATS